MALWLMVLSFAGLPKWVLSNFQVAESGPAVVRPGDVLNLVCKVTGVSVSVSNEWHWMRDSPGKGLEWVAAINVNSGGKWYTASVKNRATISADEARNEFYLQIDSVTTADSSMYFCTRLSLQPPHFDIWGKGTSVVVTSESPKAPSLFPLIPSADNSGSTDTVTVGCLAKGFLPDSLDFSWNNKDNQSIGNGNYEKFPSILSSGTYTAASQAKVPRAAWNLYDKFYCNAKHPQGNKEVTVIRQRPTFHEPKMLVRAPILKAFSSDYLNSTVTCEVSDLCSGNVAIRWLKEEREIKSGVTTTKPVSDGHGGYTIWSKFVITKEDWLSEKKFACEVTGNELKGSIKVPFSLPSFCKPSDPCLAVAVETIPPNFGDMFLTNSANLTCRISNIPVTAEYSKLNVIWTRESDNKQLQTVMTNFLEQENGLNYVDAIATVCATEWQAKESFTCKVTFEGVLVKPEEKPLQKEIVSEPKAPSVYILPPSSEELNLREQATLSCLIKDFSPSNFFVRWLQNGQPVTSSAYFTSKPIEQSKLQSKEYFAYSMLTINEQEWSSGDTFTCMVGHEALPYNSIQKTMNKNMGKPSMVNVSLVLSDASSPCY